MSTKSLSDTKPPVDPGEAADDQRDPAVERQIDKALKQSFPASDPAPVNPGADSPGGEPSPEEAHRT